jgi:signal transduction histidine kinase
MSGLLDELLELSRIGHVTSAPVSIPLADLAREVVDNVKSRPALAELAIEIGPDLPVIFGDRERLREVLQNLVENAIKFCKVEPRIEIGSRRQTREDVIFVKDNGEGIEPAYHDKIFGLFERLDQSIKGTGIGLARAHRIIEEHGGKIWVESEGPGKGSTFCFTIPPRRNSQPTLEAVGSA